jgi:hypothetical protein
MIDGAVASLPAWGSLKKETVKPEKWQCMNSCALVYRTHTSIFIKNNSKVDGQKIEIFKTRI